MRYLSVCSGVEAASLAWRGLGWEPVAFSEIEPYPCAVLKARFPNVPNLGDMTKIEVTEDEIHGNGFAIRRGSIDLIVGGTPCQSFSVAGKRAGLEGASGLAYHFVRLLREIQPRIFVWENVPGALSSRTGGQYDFNFLVREYAQCGYDVAWRILDAQFVRSGSFPWAVPQRRRRVFVVGCSPAVGVDPGKILLECAGMPWDTAPRRISRKALAEDTEGCADCAGGISFQERAGKPGGGKGILMQDGHVGAMGTQNIQSVLSFSANMGSTATTVDRDCTHPLCATGNEIGVAQIGCDIYNGTLTGEVACTCNTPCNSTGSEAKVLSVRTSNTHANGIGVAEDATHTIGANDVDAVCVDQGAGKSSCNVTEGHAPTLATTHDGAPAVAYPVAMRGNRTPEDRGKFPETDMGQSAYTVTNVQTDSMVAQIRDDNS